MATSARKEAQALATDQEAEVREMLVLALLSYRGFQDVTVPLADIPRLRGAIDRGLAQLEPVKGRWEIVWGPASYRAPFSLFDSTMMYVVREIAAPHRYVIVIRGTNPASVFDWLFGDLWAARQIPWPHGGERARDAKVSFSSALGLSTLKHLRSTGPSSGIAAGLWRFIDEDVGGRLRAATEAVLDPIRDVATALGDRMRGRVRGLTEALIADERARAAATTPDLAARIKLILAARRSRTRRDLLEFIDAAIDRIGDRRMLDAYALLDDTSWIGARLQVGQDVRTFLAAAVAHAEQPIQVTVTGHSKGGALASTTALWLADTQGTEVPPAEQWDPNATAEVRCFSFAGPTAGNEAFAHHSNATLGANCVRTINTKDIVPHAWTSTDLEEIPALYQPGVHHIGAIDDLIKEIVADQTEQKLDYAHPDVERRIEGRIDLGRPLFFDQLVYQHMEAYLHGLGLTGLNTETFFGPLD